MKLPGLVFWFVSTCAMLLAVELPLGVEAQLALAATALGAMAVIKILDLKGAFRAIFLGLGTLIILRYVFWRVTNTIPPVTSLPDFLAGITLLAAECYCVVMLFLSLFTVADPITREDAPQLSDDDAPTVDVFVPSYNEAVEIVAPTLAAAKRMKYPAGKMTVFLLDDGGTDEKICSEDATIAANAVARRKVMQTLCAELGVRYLARDENLHAKAGNLNHGLEQSEGDLVAVFDADHVPAEDFLLETVGYFDADQRLFLVQTPHFFVNPDPIERNIAVRGIPPENEMFYGLVQKGLDKWNAAYFCGSAAVLRREALEQVGGFQGVSITEDAETALEMHACGWNSLYVDKPMVAGLQPETFESFIGQRSRWCRGMMQILLLKNPLFKSGLTLAQRLCYLSSGMFWLFPLSRMIFIAAPFLFIVFNMKIYVANGQDFIAYTVTYMVSSLMIQNYVFRRVRWPWISDVYEYIQAVALFRPLLGVFLNPRRPKFRVTDKGQSLAEDGLSSLALPYYVIFIAVAASIGVLAYRYVHEPNIRDLVPVMGVWSGLNLLLTGIALGAVSERRERRAVPRIVAQGAAVLTVGSEHHAVTIEDMSISGLRITSRQSLRLPPRSTATLRVEADPATGLVFETPVVSVGRRTVNGRAGLGLKFYGYSGDRFRIIARVVFNEVGSLRAARARRQTTFGIVLGSAALLGIWGLQMGRGLVYALFRRGSGRVAAVAAKPGKLTA